MFNTLRNFFMSEPVSAEGLQKALSMIPPHTPDLWKLEQSEYQLVFEYGDLQNRMPKHQMVQPYSAYTAFTNEKFAVFNSHCEDESYPVAFKSTFMDVQKRPMRRSKVRGELFAVKAKNLMLIDSYRQNGVQFERKRVRVVTPMIDTEGKNMTADAWMYLGKLDNWKDKIEWDRDFTKGRGNLFHSLPVQIDNNPTFNNHIHFTPKDLKNGVQNKCYVYFHKKLPDPIPTQQQPPRPEPVTVSKLSFK
jgi:gamma-glutamylcyclotransferase (GGCT)/AIG2-like uncharacterized protein YtfP